jgi:hypothetical protein
MRSGGGRDLEAPGPYPHPTAGVKPRPGRGTARTGTTVGIDSGRLEA